jgi:hypothetical protein
MMMKIVTTAIGASLLLAGVQATANSLVSPGPKAQIARSSVSASPAGEWNRLSRSDGKNVEVWTRDGDGLNKVTFFGGISLGQSLYKERNAKESPLPKVADNMLIADIPVLLESTYRSQYKVNRMSIDSQEMTTLSGHQAIRFTYTFVRGEDEVARKGEAVGAVVNKKLYLFSYEAPSIYYFDKDLTNFRQIVETLKF